MSLDFTLLTKEQVFGENRLDIFKKLEAKATVTDFAILLGAFISKSEYAGEAKLENRTGWYWTRSDDGDNDARVVRYDGNCRYRLVHSRDVACRPAFSFSFISKSATNVVSSRRKNGVLEVEYGNYPQMAVNKEMQKKLENVFQRDKLKQTGNHFTVDSRRYNENDKRFAPDGIIEYEYEGKKYVRVVSTNIHYVGGVQLSNGEYYHDWEYVWVEVSPVKWFMDEKSGLVISEKLLFSGIQFHHESNYKGDFSKTDIKWYLDKYFAPELIGETFVRKELPNNEDKKNKIQAIFDQIEEAKESLEKEREKLLEEIQFFQDQNSEKIKQLKR